MNDILKKIASKENVRAGAEVALDLFLSDKSPEQKKAELSAFLRTNIENLDDSVRLLPGWGPMLALLADSQAFDAAEAQLCDALAESIVQSLRGLQNRE